MNEFIYINLVIWKTLENLLFRKFIHLETSVRQVQRKIYLNCQQSRIPSMGKDYNIK